MHAVDDSARMEAGEPRGSAATAQGLDGAFHNVYIDTLINERVDAPAAVTFTTTDAGGAIRLAEAIRFV